MGGIVRFVNKIWKARTAEERASVILKGCGYVTGTGGVIKACSSW